MKSDEHRLDRTSSNCRSTRKILPSSLSSFSSSSSLSSSSCSTTTSTSSSSISINQDHSGGDEFVGHRKPLISKPFTLLHLSNLNKSRNISAVLRSLLTAISLPTCRWLALPSKLSFTTSSPASLGRTVTGTLFGQKKGHVSFAVQEDPRSDPVLLLELATSTCTLVKEMASGLVRIALECKIGSSGSNGSTRPVKLFQEPMWTMYCNGKKCGYAMSRTCVECDWHVLSTVQTVSVGAGVIPVEKNRVGSGLDGGGGEVMYMRARFERVVGNRDSEAFYMMNPDGTGGPELSIFLLRI